MFNYMKSFFGFERAKAYKEMLINNGVEEIQISSAKDAFGQTQYRVEWN